MTYSSFFERLIGCARLDPACYEAVESDRKSNWQAIAVVLLSSVAAAIGTGIQSLTGTIGLIFAVIATWIIWVLLTLVIGTQLLPGAETRADFGQVLRTTGFSTAPGILRIFGLVPGIGGFLFFTVTLWMLLSFVVAIRQALDYTSTARALAVSLLGWLINAILFFGFELTAV
jgi:hypothetical protein